MSSFKPKANKKKVVIISTNVTLDSKHNEFLKEFQDNEEFFLPKIKKELLFLKREKQKNVSNIEKYLDIEEKINILKKEKTKLQTHKMDYLLNNSI